MNYLTILSNDSFNITIFYKLDKYLCSKAKFLCNRNEIYDYITLTHMWFKKFVNRLDINTLKFLKIIRP
jgi:hypothetical protein